MKKSTPFGNATLRNVLVVVTVCVLLVTMMIAIFLISSTSRSNKPRSRLYYSEDDEVSFFGSDGEMDCSFLQNVDVEILVNEAISKSGVQLSSHSHRRTSESDESDYECSGVCYCESDRRNIATITASRGLKYLVSGLTAAVAYSIAKDKFSDDCERLISDECGTAESIRSEFEGCEFSIPSHEIRVVDSSNFKETIVVHAENAISKLYRQCESIDTFFHDSSPLTRMKSEVKKTEATLLHDLSMLGVDEGDFDLPYQDFNQIFGYIARFLGQHLIEAFMDMLKGEKKEGGEDPDDEDKEDKKPEGPDRVIGSGKCTYGDKNPRRDLVRCDDAAPKGMRFHFERNVFPFGNFETVAREDIGFANFYEGMKSVLGKMCAEKNGELDVYSVHIEFIKGSPRLAQCGLFRSQIEDI